MELRTLPARPSLHTVVSLGVVCNSVEPEIVHPERQLRHAVFRCARVNSSERCL